MRLFVAGIMQGSHRGEVLHNQDYRPRLKRLLCQHLPGIDVYDPLADHQDSLHYDGDKGRRVFLEHNRMCGEVDVVLAFLPEASMGTAIEIWEAHRHGRVVVTISPLQHNWAVRFLSDILYADLEDFETDLASGKLARRIAAAADRNVSRPWAVVSCQWSVVSVVSCQWSVVSGPCHEVVSLRAPCSVPRAPCSVLLLRARLCSCVLRAPCSVLPAPCPYVPHS